MSMTKIPEFATLAYDDTPTPVAGEARPLPVWDTPEGIPVAANCRAATSTSLAPAVSTTVKPPPAK